MGKFTGSSYNSFKSPKFIYAKIQRQWKSFGAANLLDDADFPLYTAEALKDVGNGAYKEEKAILFVKDGKAQLPKDFKTLNAAYKCCNSNSSFIAPTNHLQNRQTIFTDVTNDFLCGTNCDFEFNCDSTTLINRMTIRQYVSDGGCDGVNRTYDIVGLLKVSPNARVHCSQDCLNIHPTCNDEITINDGCVFTNFKDADIYIEYYAFPFGEDGSVMIPDIPAVEKMVEWFIKWQLLLNYWFVDDLANAANKWEKAEQLYEQYYAEARFNDKLPSFGKLVDSARKQRTINKVAFFSQIDHNQS